MTAAHDDLDPRRDQLEEEGTGTRRNFAKVGSARPPSLMYTYGPGALMDLPNITIMPAGLDEWYRGDAPAAVVEAPRLLREVRRMTGNLQLRELRKHPWIPNRTRTSNEGDLTGVPARVFPQWLRCTGCDSLAPVRAFTYTNKNRYQPDKAEFTHDPCPGRRGARGGKSRGRKRPQSATPARYLLACPMGHLDEFPYDAWVHEGGRCPRGVPQLYMVESPSPRGSSSVVECRACGGRRTMREAQGSAGEEKLPRCRGRHPHLGTFAPQECPARVKLLLVGASNLWFPALQSIVVMPTDTVDRSQVLLEALRDQDPDVVKLGYESGILTKVLARDERFAGASEEQLAQLVPQVLAPPEESPESGGDDLWDPVSLLVPEFDFLCHQATASHQGNRDFQRSQQAVPEEYRSQFTQVQSVEKLRKVNALVGFTRIDEMERVGDLRSRMVPLSRAERQSWTVVTEDRGEGIYLQLDEDAVSAWEERVEGSSIWMAHENAHERNYNRRFSETAVDGGHKARMRPKRYWLVHTLSHVLLREMAMYSGYSAASLTERIYAWERSDDRSAAAGVLISTTASDSDGTLGGLVALSDPATLGPLLRRALRRAQRCSSDPICAHRTPQDPEDFLHGASCHNCSMASETSCERANRFLDRRFLIDLPGATGLGFFDVH